MYLVNSGHADGRYLQLIGKEEQMLSALLVEEVNSAKRPGKVGVCYGKGRLANLIAANAFRISPEAAGDEERSASCSRHE